MMISDNEQDCTKKKSYIWSEKNILPVKSQLTLNVVNVFDNDK